MSSKPIALITGASSGIGKAVALKLSESGYALALCARRIDALEQVKQASAHADDVLCIATDVGDEADVGKAVDETVDRFGRIDVLFNNAGISADGKPIEETDIAHFDQVVAINLRGAFLMAQRVYQQMAAQSPQGGRIINNGSISANVPRPNGISYNMTKHAISGLTKSIALEGRRHNVACGQIDIGNAATDMTAKMVGGMLQADGSVKAEARFDVRHVADAVLYMANLPLEANVQSMTVLATTMPYVGRG